MQVGNKKRKRRESEKRRDGLLTTKVEAIVSFTLVFSLLLAARLPLTESIACTNIDNHVRR